MNKNFTSISIVVLSSLLLAGCTIPGSSKPQTVSQAANEASEFAKAIESGKPTICTMTKGTDSMEYSIKSKKMRIKSRSRQSREVSDLI